MKKAATILAVAGLVFVMADPVGAASFGFDPGDFFDYRPVADGFSTEGGMFKLHETWNDQMYRSWTDDGGQRAAVDSWVAGLGEGEGIAQFNIWLADQENGPAWGEALVSSGDVMPSGSAPAGSGWSVDILENEWPDGENGRWLVSWSTDDPAKYIRPGNSPGEFGFSFQPTSEVVLGQDYTIWFGGINKDVPGGDDYSAALIFDDSGGFASQFVEDDNGSGFEATLRLTAVPEPSTVVLALLAALGLAAMACRRRRA